MRFEGRVWLLGDGVDTDVLAPGAYMRLPPAELASHCLEAVRPDFAASVKPGDMILAGRGFGVGSSREQAVESLKILGITAVIARSFGGIFQRNAFNFGLACLSCPDLDTSAMAELDTAGLDLATGQLMAGGQNWDCEQLPDFLLAMIADGGLIPHLKKQPETKVSA